MKKLMILVLCAAILLITACGEGAKPAPAGEYEVGDIVLSDGSVIKVGELTAIYEDNMPIAIIAGLREDGGALGVGVHISDTPLQWAADGTAGYEERFENIVCTQNSASSFSGDNDGSDNWSEVYAQDESGGLKAEKNYPAFYFAITYAERYGAEGEWYMPSIEELYTIYQNRDKINSSLRRIAALDANAAVDGLGSNWYWSSSQAECEDEYAWFVHYLNGYAGECPKNFTNVHALAVRVF